MFRKFFDRSDPLNDSADKLVDAARTNAASLYIAMSMSGEFALLRDVKEDDWDFFVTVASVFLAATCLRNLGVGDAREEKLTDRVRQQFVQWDDPQKSWRAFEDCKSFFEQRNDALTKLGHEPRVVASDAIGNWVVLNLRRPMPEGTAEEPELMRAIGDAIVHTFYNWWK